MSLCKMLKKKNIWSMFPFGSEVFGENVIYVLENPDPKKEITDNLFSQALEDFCQVLLTKSYKYFVLETGTETTLNLK